MPAYLHVGHGYVQDTMAESVVVTELITRPIKPQILPYRLSRSFQKQFCQLLGWTLRCVGRAPPAQAADS